MSNLLLSLLVPYRTCPMVNGSYPNLNIIHFVNNLNNILLKSEQDKIELLIKMDSDDTKAIETIPRIKKIANFNIKVIISDRKQGRSSINI